MLRTLLLLLATLLCAHGGRWDTATCTEGVVSVPRGRRAEMGCRIANAFSHVTVLLCVHGNHCQTIFSEEGPGNFSQGGWHLRVQGGVAQLVIEDAQTSQAGMYKWRLAGLQRNVRFTTLNVSEPQAPEDAPEESGGIRAPTQATEALRAPPQARQVAMERSVLAAAVLAGGAVLALSWRWCRGARTRAQMWRLSLLSPGLMGHPSRAHLAEPTQRNVTKACEPPVLTDAEPSPSFLGTVGPCAPWRLRDATD